MTRTRAPRRWTRAVLHAGTVVGGACLAAGMALEVVGRPGTAGSVLDPSLVASELTGLGAWGWSTLGVWVVIATPVAALGTTAFEYALIDDRRAVWATLGVLALLAVSLVVGLVRAG